MNETKNTSLKPDYIFEVSWEVCNKIGGIYTVISSKYPSLASSVETHGSIIMIGPDVWKETSDHPDFEEDMLLMKSWRELAASQGLFFRIGRWKIPGNPIAVLVDFTSYFSVKDKIFTDLWTNYGLDSISGQWDYIEPAMFGYAAGRVIESFYRTNLSIRDRVVAQFHEWLTGTGVLYLKEKTPGIATVFTTHATVLGRAMAGNGKPLYELIDKIDPNSAAAEFRVKSKYSLEKIAAKNSDMFTTVSENTANECLHFLEREPDFITVNGFDNTIALINDDDDNKRVKKQARKKLFSIFSALFNTNFSDDTSFILTSGRYEYRNKGIDIFIKAIADLRNSEKQNNKIVAVIAVPAYIIGPRQDLIEKIDDKTKELDMAHHALTHVMHDQASDPVIKQIDKLDIRNNPEDDVFICFIPDYINERDGLFNLSYYHFLSAFDLTVFPSYYEPWGYTPLESISLGIPTVTTSLAGFGKWAKKFKSDSVKVIDRDDNNDDDVTKTLVDHINSIIGSKNGKKHQLLEEAVQIAHKANWKDFITYYLKAYEKALSTASSRAVDDPFDFTNGKKLRKKDSDEPVWNKVLIKASYPEQLEKLRELAGNIWWSWHPEAIDLFKSINPTLWNEAEMNPIKLLSLLSYNEMQDLTNDTDFMQRLEKVSTHFENYLNDKYKKDEPHVAYFCMEYGLHENLKTYSGGLGVLAGDFLKEASDSNKNITGVGLLYRYGYFTQKISPYGEQISAKNPQKFSELPIHPVRDENGEWVKIAIAFPGRNIYAKVWQVNVGRVKLYLMDTDIDENSPNDKVITHQLYGGDQENRFKQELLLGVGGIRLVEKLNLKPDVYHCNEGHAAFIVFERIRLLIQDDLLTFEEALEVVRASTLFTTHTPVPAGHDRFNEELIRAYIAHYPERLHITWEDLIALGRDDNATQKTPFSMSILAMKTAGEVNGVSKIHEGVSRKMFNPLYKGYFPEELHINHVTNGIHYPTWTHEKWNKLIGENVNIENVNKKSIEKLKKIVKEIPDKTIWDIRQTLKNELLTFLKKRLIVEMSKRQESPGHIVRVIDSLDQPFLTVGFARRFATYKRAHLIFSNEEQLKRLLNEDDRQVRFIFAGKAHPNDKAGQDLIKRIIEYSHKPAFEGKIIFVENYDMQLGRLMVQGCDVWMNTPARPLEASGTSGEKAVMNGVLNLSVLDGWWAEGYVTNAGWALPEDRMYEKPAMQDQLDAETIYNLFEDKIKPGYYNRDENNIPEIWIDYIRNNFARISQKFTMKRMVKDYFNKFYLNLADRNKLFTQNDFKNAKALAAYKKRILLHWDNIVLLEKNTPDSSKSPLKLGDMFIAELEIYAPGLNKEDLGVEVIFGEKENDKVNTIFFNERLDVKTKDENILVFSCKVPTTRSGVYDYAFRLFPQNDLMTYRMEFPLVKWL